MQVPKTLDRFHDQLSDDEACLESLTPIRRPGGFVCPGIDASHLGGTASGGPHGRDAPNKRLLRHLPGFGYRFSRRAKEDE
jgi:hypothetical protein